MCLQIESCTEKQIADEDIICYKRILEKTVYSNKYDGLKFKGTINNVECEGRISVIKRNRGNDGDLYFCTHDERLDGAYCRNKHGYNYSWIYDESSNIDVKLENGDLIESTICYTTPYQKVRIEIGKTYKSSLRRTRFTVENGLHSFAYLNEAKSGCSDLVVKCVIPKGSSYYFGKFGLSGKKSYASDCVTYLEII